MKFATRYLTFETEQRRQLIRITAELQGAVEEAGIEEGMVLASALHTSAGIWVNDDEPGLHEDRGGEDNGDAHLENLLVHRKRVVIKAMGE